MGTGADQEPEEPPQPTALPHTPQQVQCLLARQGPPCTHTGAPPTACSSSGQAPSERRSSNSRSSRGTAPPPSQQDAAAHSCVAARLAGDMQRAHVRRVHVSSTCYITPAPPLHRSLQWARQWRLNDYADAADTQQGLAALQANYNQRAMQQHGPPTHRGAWDQC